MIAPKPALYIFEKMNDISYVLLSDDPYLTDLIRLLSNEFAQVIVTFTPYCPEWVKYSSLYATMQPPCL